jgi:hypothetical protein
MSSSPVTFGIGCEMLVGLVILNGFIWFGEGSKLERRTSDSVFFGYHAKAEFCASEKRFWAFIQRAICLEANLNVKREMSESFGKPG